MNKMKLDNLKVSSFITNLNEKEENVILGGCDLPGGSVPDRTDPCICKPVF